MVLLNNVFAEKDDGDEVVPELTHEIQLRGSSTTPNSGGNPINNSGKETTTTTTTTTSSSSGGGGGGSMAATANNTFVDRIDPFAKRSLKKKQKKSQGSSRYHQANEADLVPLPLFKGKNIVHNE